MATSADRSADFGVDVKISSALRSRLSDRVAELVEDDNVEGLHEFLEEERKKLGSTSSGKHTANKRNKRNKGITVKEEDAFMVLLRYVYHYACTLDALDSVSSLISGEEDSLQVYVDTVDDSDGRTGLHHAALHHSTSCIEVLLQHGANTNIRNKEGLCPLEEALRSPKTQVDWCPDKPAGHFVTRLREKDLTTLKLLGDKSKDQLVRVAFKLATELQIIPLAALLLSMRGSFVNMVARGADYSGVESDESGTLVDLLIGKILRAGGALNNFTVGQSSGGWGMDEYTNFVDSKREDVKTRKEAIILLETLLIFGARLSAHPQSSETSPLLRAAQMNDVALLDLLLDSGAPLTETDSDGNTALHWALRQASTGNGREVDCRLVKRLIDKGANVLHGNKLGATPVHTAAGHGHADALRLLLAQEPSGSNVMAATKETPLHYAVKNNHMECAEVLLLCGANRHVVSLRNQRPGQLAMSAEMRALLEESEPTPASAPADSHRAAWEAASFSSHLQPGQASPWSHLADDPSDKSGGHNVLAYRTSLCRFHLSPDGCSYGARCHYAHTEEELRPYGSSDPGFARVAPASTSSAVAEMQAKTFKTKICQYYERGTCPHGSKCKFAHGESDLRAFPANKPHPRPSTASSFASSSDEDDDYLLRKVFVGGLPHYITAEDLVEFFDTNFGRVADAVVITTADDDGSQRSRGFGFVIFEDSNNANEAVARHWVPFRGRRVEVKRAQARGTSPTGLDQSARSTSAIPDRAQSSYSRPPPYSVSSSALSSPQAPLSPALSSRSFRADDTIALFNDGIQLSAGGSTTHSSHGHGPGPASSQNRGSHPHATPLSHHAESGGMAAQTGWSLPPLSVPPQAPLLPHAPALTTRSDPLAPSAAQASRPSFLPPGPFAQRMGAQPYLDSPVNGLYNAVPAQPGPSAYPGQPAVAAGFPPSGALSSHYWMDSNIFGSAPGFGYPLAGDFQQPSQERYSSGQVPNLGGSGDYGFGGGRGGHSLVQEVDTAGDDDDISELLALLNPGASGFSEAAGGRPPAGAGLPHQQSFNGQQPVHRPQQLYAGAQLASTEGAVVNGNGNGSNGSVYHLPSLNEFLSG